MKSFGRLVVAISLALLPLTAIAQEDVRLSLTSSWVGITALAMFVTAYLVVATEEYTHLRKSKPMILAAGLMWALVALVYAQHGIEDAVEHSVREFLLEFAELLLFLLVAMTYVNALSERCVFDALRTTLIRKGYSLRKLFWITGFLAFFLSPVLDNLTTALVMCAVAMAVGRESPGFVALACVNIVVASNAGGVFSPFGDITSLMVWQAGMLQFTTFFALFVPALVNYVVPAFIMQFAVPRGAPATDDEAAVHMKRGAKTIMLLFGLTIATAVSFQNFLDLPPFLGMMTGLAYLKFYGYYLRRTHKPSADYDPNYGIAGDVTAFDSFEHVARAEWDTLLFFFGVIMGVGALGFIGYLEVTSSFLYGELGPTTANTLIGVLSALMDNIPVMVAVLQMQPEMDVQQWLLVALTAGAGGSMLSIGSAAGVALMGQSRGVYTFVGHLRWTPAIALGYILSILVHLWINSGYQGVMPWQAV